MSNKKHIRLSDIRDIKKLLSKLINERYRDEVDSFKARDIGYLAKCLLEAYEKSELEERLAELEKKLMEKE